MNIIDTTNTGDTPAYPCKLPHQNTIGEDARDFHFFSGITIHDYFAAKAMQGMVSSIKDEEGYSRMRRLAWDRKMTVSQWIASESNKQADAMIEARGIKS